MGRIEWAMWANVQAVYGAPCTLMGGIIGVFDFKNEWAAYYAIAISVLVWLVEYPRSKRRSGNTPSRPFQEYVAPVWNALGPLYKFYHVRFIFHLAAAIPLFFCLPTILGGIFMVSSGTLYFVAALLGEKWIPIKLAFGSGAAPPVAETRGQISAPPSHPPPRGPLRASASGISDD